MRNARSYKADPITLNRPVQQRPCDFPGCAEVGTHKAPRSRDRLNEYYWFCLDHVRDYNAQWDYLKGLSVEQIEAHIRHAAVWERPTWSFSEAQRKEKILRESLRRDFFKDDSGSRESVNNGGSVMAAGEQEALTVLELDPPTDFAAIKARYRKLVKRHHPDANGGSHEAEEKFKRLNQAFTALRAIYDKNKRQ